MKINKVHCFFEQSGTFKNAFKKYGVKAADYDIQDEFGETDHIVDLFVEIERAFDGRASIFDDIDKDDLIFAFFPCIRFENQIMLHFRGQAYQQKTWNDEDKCLYDLRLLDEVREMYQLINKLFVVCLRGGVRLIVENPYSEEHFLRRYWCISPSIIDKDRRENGDYSKKPTQYWFVNCKPEQNVLFEPLPENSLMPITNKQYGRWASMRKEDYEAMGATNATNGRSLIHPDYADRFIRQYVLDEMKGNENELFERNYGGAGNDPD